ncbi:MAG: SDR family oxidoreductase [Actinobacteria bacterium]|nr:SDR family oxidoreductase [Actinomycetota bacterium]
MSAARFAGKTAIVTGAAGDIGRAVSLRLAEEGARVLAVDLDQAGLEKTVALVADAGGTGRAAVADVTDAAAVRGYVEDARALGGGSVDVLFNNAGIEGPTEPIWDYSEEWLEKVLAVNLKGVFFGLKYAAAAIRAGGAIVNTSSVAGVVGFGGMSGYVASKHAVIGLTRSAALDLGPRGIRVNAICPGPVEGRMMASLEDRIDPDHGHEMVLSTVPLGRFTTPAEIAATVAFLLSPEAGYATGAIFSLDGGQTAQ